MEHNPSARSVNETLCSFSGLRIKFVTVRVRASALEYRRGLVSSIPPVIAPCPTLHPESFESENAQNDHGLRAAQNWQQINILKEPHLNCAPTVRLPHKSSRIMCTITCHNL